MSHSEQRFCTWCEVQGRKKEELNIGRLRNGQGVCDISYHYYDLKSKTKKETLAQITAVRWSELNCLPDLNPVLNVMLGVMHNWFEGILQHHFRDQWGFYCKSETQHNDSDSESDDMEICKVQM
ncbi:hypothetical protein O181_078248 [Austropuccinia psidii MF-1]|uniref:Uncharacterized protein n=1 Tax=Austropuccinia psidii MF-1 TaxID=1389203 RepID=A0A9Q3FEE1_9BASI|nr:hypothetical protein [Austropuccinia psidii MF-1]